MIFLLCPKLISRYIQRSEYSAALRCIKRTSKSGRKALGAFLATTIDREVKKFIRLTHCSIKKELSLETLSQFSWDSVLGAASQHLPFLYSLLSACVGTRYCALCPGSIYLINKTCISFIAVFLCHLYHLL